MPLEEERMIKKGHAEVDHVVETDVSAMDVDMGSYILVTVSLHMRARLLACRVLIVRLLSNLIGYKTVLSQIQALWKLVSEVQVVDMDNNYFISWFSEARDYTKTFHKNDVHKAFNLDKKSKATSRDLSHVSLCQPDCFKKEIYLAFARSSQSGVDVLWLIGGDFNSILSADKRYGDASQNQSGRCFFAEFIFSMGLVDLGFLGLISLGIMGIYIKGWIVICLKRCGCLVFLVVPWLICASLAQ
ncbi:hypothetical protein V6N12_007509 [Hibiscus sabdariffa]|uniref:Uncharacterized protein n=1 Tax=Hibiscus sabdariffa TaxID=183260 RepID=A0ABR2F1Y8_9ROSI